MVRDVASGRPPDLLRRVRHKKGFELLAGPSQTQEVFGKDMRKDLKDRE